MQGGGGFGQGGCERRIEVSLTSISCKFVSKCSKTIMLTYTASINAFSRTYFSNKISRFGCLIYDFIQLFRFVLNPYRLL